MMKFNNIISTAAKFLTGKRIASLERTGLVLKEFGVLFTMAFFFILVVFYTRSVLNDSVLNPDKGMILIQFFLVNIIVVFYRFLCEFFGSLKKIEIVGALLVLDYFLFFFDLPLMLIFNFLILFLFLLHCFFSIFFKSLREKDFFILLSDPKTVSFYIMFFNINLVTLYFYEKTLLAIVLGILGQLISIIIPPTYAEDKVLVLAKEIAQKIYSNLDKHTPAKIRQITMENPVFIYNKTSNPYIVNLKEILKYNKAPKPDTWAYIASHKLNNNSFFNWHLVNKSWVRHTPPMLTLVSVSEELYKMRPQVIAQISLFEGLSQVQKESFSEPTMALRVKEALFDLFGDDKDTRELFAVIQPQFESETSQLMADAIARDLKKTNPSLVELFDKSEHFNGVPSRVSFDKGGNMPSSSAPDNTFGTITNTKTVVQGGKELKHASKIIDPGVEKVEATSVGDDALIAQSGRYCPVDYKGKNSSSAPQVLEEYKKKLLNSSDPLYKEFHENNKTKYRPVFTIVYDNDQRELTSDEKKLMKEISQGVQERYQYSLEIRIIFNDTDPKERPWNQ